MTKNIKLLMNYLLYFGTLIIICIIGVSNVLADAITTQDVTWYYRQMSNESNMLSTIKSVDNYINLVANGTNNQEYLNGYTTRISNTFHKDAQYNLNYTLTMQYSEAIDSMFRSDTVSRLKNYSYVDSDFTLISSTVDQITYKCQNSQCFRVFSISLSMKANNNTSAVRFGVYTTNNISIGFYDHLGGSSYQSTVSMILSNTTSLNENGDSVIIGQNETIINQNNQAMEEARENTQDIINNNDSNTQDIINNNNQNTQDIINSNKENFNTITDCMNIWDEQWENGSFNNNTGQTIANNNKIRSKNYIPIQPNTQYYVVTPIILNAYYYDSSKNFVSANTQSGINGSFTTPNNAYYMMFSTFGTETTAYSNNIAIFKGTEDTTYCKYGSKVYINKLDETNNSINNLDNTLKDDSIDENGIASAFDDFNSFLDDNSTITQLITLPITLYTAILNNLNGTCQPFNLGQLYGEDLILPCINISQYLGNSLWTMIDIIISGFAVYAIGKKMIKVFNNFSSLREGDVIDD